MTGASATGEVVLRMRLLEPRAVEFAVALKRRFRYIQQIGSGEIEKTERYLQARETWIFDPKDITPPRLELRDLVASAPGFPRRGAVTLVLDEAPRHSEPAPAKQATVRVEPSRGFHERFEVESQGADGPYSMARAGSGFSWAAHVSTLEPATPTPGLAAVPRDFFAVEDAPLSVRPGHEVLTEDNGPGVVAVTVAFEGPGTAAGFPTPNFVYARDLPEGRQTTRGLVEGAPRYAVVVTATDAAGNQTWVRLPVAVLDVTPPDIQLSLRSQDANELKVWTEEDPVDLVPGDKRVSILLSGPYLDPLNEPGLEYNVAARLGFADAWPLPWTLGLYAGSEDGDPRNTDPTFGAQVPAALRGAFIPANARVTGQFQVADNDAGSQNQAFLAEVGYTWDVQTLDGASISGINPERFMVRVPNFPPEDYPDAPQYRFVIRGEDLSGNALELKIPVFFTKKDFQVQQLDYQQSRVRRRPPGG